MASKNATIKYDGNTMYIGFPYSAEAVSALKETTKSRRWNPATKQWAIDIEERHSAIDALRQFFDVVEVNQPDSAQTPSTLSENKGNLFTGVQLDAWTDGACQPVNPGGTAGYGLVVKRGNETILRKCAVVGHGKEMSNNVAEYCGLIALLEWLKANSIEGKVTVHSDSNLLVNQMGGKWKTSKSKGLYVSYQKQALALLHSLGKIQFSFEWIPTHFVKTSYRSTLKIE